MIGCILQNGLCTEGVVTKHFSGVMIRIVHVWHRCQMNNIICFVWQAESVCREVTTDEGHVMKWGAVNKPLTIIILIHQGDSMSFLRQILRKAKAYKSRSPCNDNVQATFPLAIYTTSSLKRVYVLSITLKRYILYHFIIVFCSSPEING